MSKRKYGYRGFYFGNTGIFFGKRFLYPERKAYKKARFKKAIARGRYEVMPCERR